MFHVFVDIFVLLPTAGEKKIQFPCTFSFFFLSSKILVELWTRLHQLLGTRRFIVSESSIQSRRRQNAINRWPAANTIDSLGVAKPRPSMFLESRRASTSIGSSSKKNRVSWSSFFHGRNKLLQNVNNNRTCRHEPVTQRLFEQGQMFRALQKTMHRKIFRATTREFNNRTEMFDIKSTSMSVRSLSLPHTARPPRLRISRPTSR